MKGFKGLFIKYEILIDIKLNDKEKIVYSMIEYLSKNMDCIITNSYISNLLNISKTQSSRIVNGLKKKEYPAKNYVFRQCLGGKATPCSCKITLKQFLRKI